MRRLIQIVGLLGGLLCLSAPEALAQSGSNMCAYPPASVPLDPSTCWAGNINGVTKTIKASQITQQAVNGPTSTIVGDLAVWNNTTGTLLRDGGSLPAISPKSFGAVGNCIHDDAPALQAALNAAVLLASNYPDAATTGGNNVTVDLGGSCMALGSGVSFTANGIAIQNGKIVPANNLAGTLVTVHGGYNTIRGLYCDGRKTADCFDASDAATVFAFQALNNEWLHMPNFGLKMSMGAGLVSGNIGTQWLSSDAEFVIQGDLTARVLWLMEGDGLVTNNIMHNGLYPLACGDDISRGCSNILFTGNHFYNGVTPATPGTGMVDPISVHVDANSGELQFTNTYLDNGIFESSTPAISFSGNLTINAKSVNTLKSWFHFIPQSNAESFGSFHFKSPVTVGGTGVSTPLFNFGPDCTAVSSSTPCWTGSVAYAGINTILSATYNAGSGAVTLTMQYGTNYLPGSAITVNQLTGTGSFAAAQGNFTAGTGTTGTTVTYVIATGLTMTIAGGSVGLLPTQFEISNGPGTTVTNNTGNTSHQFVANNTADYVTFVGAFPGAIPSGIGQDFSNNMVIQTNGKPGFVVGNDQSVRFPSAATPLTCNVNCGAGYGISGSSNTWGNVTLGTTSLASPITITFSPQWKNFSGTPVVPNCIVQEPAALNDVLSVLTSSTTLVIALNTPTTGRVIQWFCSFNAAR